MRIRLFSLLFLTSICITSIIQASSNSSLENLVRSAVSENNVESRESIESLRAMGPEGLRALLNAHAQHIDQYTKSDSATNDLTWQRLKYAIDTVSQQYDGYTSRLYWYTDLEKAKEEARKSNKPILSLHMLGNLNEEFSCANSRFFRTALYANMEVSKHLSERYILHWKSVRPVPRITIDFGDGRKLERTITGNSIHYILNSEGSPIDALPGLYGPQAFIRELGMAEEVLSQCNARKDKCQELLRKYHSERIKAVDKDLDRDSARVGVKKPEGLAIVNTTNRPDAREASRLAMTKAIIERPLLRAMPEEANRNLVDDPAWARIAELYREDAKLSDSSKKLISKQLFDGKSSAEFYKVIQSFERSIALDTVRNKYILHRQLHDWFSKPEANAYTLEELNERVYAQLFLTPSSDPWLGLLSTDSYTGLEKGGVVR
jgi:hypothetical protein